MVALALLGGFVLPAQMQWTLMGPATNVIGGPWAYDTARDRIVSWGLGTSFPWAIYEFDGQQWIQDPVVPPQNLGVFNMTYDEGRQRIVVFAGGPPPETWEYDGLQWRQFTVPGPSYRFAPMTYHAGRRTVMIFGGQVVLGAPNELWEWDGSRWQQIVSPNAPPAQDAWLRPLEYTTLAYDHQRDVLVVYGVTAYRVGTTPQVELPITWEWDAIAGWQQSNVGGPAEQNRWLVYDRARRTHVLFTELHLMNQTWERTGAGMWVQVQGLSGQGERPVYDSRRGRILTRGQQLYWYEPTNPASFTTFAPGCPGSVGTPRLLQTEPWTGAWTGDTMSVTVTGLPLAIGFLLLGFSNTSSGGVQLPYDLVGLGMPGCALHVAPDRAAFLAGTGSSAIHQLPVPDDPFLFGLRFYLQAVSADPGAGNALGATVSDAAEALVGWR